MATVQKASVIRRIPSRYNLLPLLNPLLTEAVHLSLSPQTERSRSCEAPSVRFSPLKGGEEDTRYVMPRVDLSVIY